MHHVVLSTSLSMCWCLVSFHPTHIHAGSHSNFIMQMQVLALVWGLALAQAQTHMAPLEQGALEPLAQAVAMTPGATKVLP